MQAALPHIARPDASEHAPYYSLYIDQVGEEGPLASLQRTGAQMRAWMEGLSPEEWAYRYGPDKWTVAQLVGHIIDCEWIFAVRALRIARGDQTPQPGFEQDDYAAHWAARDLSELAAQYASMRQASLGLLCSIAEGDWKRLGVANDSPLSVRAVAYILAGHELHHLGILRDRYGFSAL